MPEEPLTGERAAYLEIADWLRTQMAEDAFEGGKLPTGGELRERFDVSQETVRKAIDVLKAEGRVEPRLGRGVYTVTKKTQTRDVVKRYQRAEWAAGRSAGQVDLGPGAPQHGTDLNAVTEEAASAAIAEKLGVNVGDPVTVRRRRNLEDDVPFQYAVSYLPGFATIGTPATQLDSGPGGSWARLEEAGWHFTRIIENVESVIPTFEQAKRLRVPASVPIFVIHRNAYGAKGDAAEVVLDYSVIELPANRRILQYEVSVI